ncbi:MAG: hypothetical protein CM1200mP14_09270 [Gammaproteobacteria bacterium]|nr:MAG: hypothetical protein CM1200mP14_09270 [Gammaproteobacteria bacterium]
MGDVVLGELLADRGLIPTFERELDYFVVVVSAQERPEALRMPRPCGSPARASLILSVTNRY